MTNTKENRIKWLKAQFKRLTQGVDEKKLVEAVEELNSALSKRRKIRVAVRMSELRSELWSELGSGLKSELRSELWSKLESEPRTRLWLELKSGIWSELKSELGPGLGSELRSELWSKLGLGIGMETWEYYDNLWSVFVGKFYPHLKTVKKNKKIIDALQKIVEAGSCYLWISKTTIYVLPFPEIHLDENKRLHNTKGYALKIADKESYWIHGVRFPKVLWQKVKSPRVRLKTILSIKNTEQRMAVLRLHGVERVLKKGILIDKSEKGNELYLVVGVFTNPTYFLKFRCPSTGRVFVEGVRPEIGEKRDADLAQASMWGLTKEEYLSLEIET